MDTTVNARAMKAKLDGGKARREITTELKEVVSSETVEHFANSNWPDVIGRRTNGLGGVKVAFWSGN